MNKSALLVCISLMVACCLCACPENQACDGAGVPITTLQHKVLKAGDGQSFAKTGQQVTVHYTGTLVNGNKFDSSKDRNQPFVFTLGVGQVIKCWDQGVALMSKGEVATLTCPSDIAYGDRGYPPVIPPKATLIFEVELISFN